MTITKTLTAVSAGLALTLFAGVSAVAGEASQKTTVHNFEDASVIDGANATLMRMDSGVYMTIDTVGLTPGHAVTAWFVVFNKPDNCSGGECGEDDIFNLDADGKFILPADGSPPMNMDGIESANISVLRLDGLIIDTDGKANYRGHLPLNDASEAIFGAGLVDAHKAEIHAVIRDHQEPKPGMANEMVNSMNGGCSENWPNDPCVDLQFAVFKPAM